jgi:Flp pilus assembly protein TadB
MKYTNILTFNTRAIALYVSLLFGEPWAYFVFEIVVLTMISLYMHYRHEKMCARFYAQYAQQ